MLYVILKEQQLNKMKGIFFYLNEIPADMQQPVNLIWFHMTFHHHPCCLK